MAESFIGMTVNVKQHPPHSPHLIIGVVQAIHGQLLVLSHVFLPESGTSLPSWSIPSAQILDIEVTNPVSSKPLPQNKPAHAPESSAPVAQQPPPVPVAKTPVKPAFLAQRPGAFLTPSRKSTSQVESPVVATPVQNSEVIVPQPTQQQSGKKGKGWRQTPLLEPVNQTPKALPVRSAKSAKKMTRRAREELDVQQSGWGTEDATDVQDMPDFDFIGNLSKFDKKAVFDEIRQEDMTAEGDRLVSHNRIARPGTYGGKNLHPTEMVLSPPVKATATNGNAGSEDSSDLDLANGRTSRQSLRSRPRSGMAPERKFSGAGDERSASRPLRTTSSQVRPLNTSVLSSNSLNRSTSSFFEARTQSSGPYLHVPATGGRCPVISPDKLVAAQEKYAALLGLSAAMLTELTAAAIARSITRLCSPQQSTRRNSRPSSRNKPVIVFLCGNHSLGALALAAARHLVSRPYKLLVSLASHSREELWHDDVLAQASLLESSRAKPDAWPAVLAGVKKLSSPPALIIDALLDGISFGGITDVNTALEAREQVDWCNRSRAPVVSLTIPSGHDAWTGETTVRDGEPVAIRAGRVLGLGGVVEGVLGGLSEGEQWVVEVLDVGLEAVLAKDKVGFGAEWSIEAEMLMPEAV